MAGILERFIRLLSAKRGGSRRSVEQGSRLFATPRDEAAFRKLNDVAPLASELCHKPPVQLVTQSSAPLAAPPARAIVCREAVLGQDRRVAGYHLSLGYKINPRVRASSTSIQRVYDQVLIRHLQGMGIQRLLAHRRAFVEVSASSLDMPFLQAPNPRGIVYVVDIPPQAEAPLEATRAALARLKMLGYRIGLRAPVGVGPDLPPLLALADFLFIDVGNSDIPVISDQIDAARKQLAAIRLVATNIRTLEEYRVCASLPFAYYHGPFISSREKLDAQTVDAGRLKLLELLNKLRSDAEQVELATLIKQNLALTYKLLRYINSPGMGQTHKIVTPEQALMVLGRQKFYRWLTLLLFTSGATSGLDRALMENALIRARLAELAAQDALSSDECDELFVAGMFSLLDVVLSMPMEAVLKQVHLPPPVDEVLRHQEGKYAPYLDLAIACEQSDNADVARLAQAVGLEIWHVNAFHLDAMLWAQQLGD